MKEKKFTYDGITISREMYANFEHGISCADVSDKFMKEICVMVRHRMSSNCDEIEYYNKHKDEVDNPRVQRVQEDLESTMEIVAVLAKLDYIEDLQQKKDDAA